MKLIWCVILGWVLVGCMPGSTGGGSVLVHPNFPYGATYDDRAAKSVMGDDWKLETYRRKTQQKPTDPIDLERKDDNEAEYEFDFDDDDRADAKAELPMPDLLFVNKRTNARLEVVTLLLDMTHEKKELRLLLNDVVASGTGTRSLFVGFGHGAAGVEKHLASRLVDSEEATLGGQRGLVATIETTDLDQKQINPQARSRMARLFLMRAPFDYYARETPHAGEQAKYHRYRVLLMVEYSNAPEDFEAQYAEYLRLMNKLHLMGDLRMLAYFRELLTPCKSGSTNQAALTLQIAPDGWAVVKTADGLEKMCTDSIARAYPFAATGEARIINGSYDFSQPAKRPAWLDSGEYAETRAPAAAAPATSPAAPAAPAPAVAPADAAPTAPAPVAPTPATSAGAPAPAAPVAPAAAVAPNKP